MSNPIDQLPRTALAATAWTDSHNREHIRVYFQDRKYQIRESQWDGQHWTGGTDHNIIAKDARLATPMAVTCWVPHGDTVQIRLYYLNDKNHLREMCWVGDKWISGELNDKNVEASSASQLAAINWSKGGYINVYYQRNDNVVQEYRHTDKWFSDKTLNKALTGTALAAIQFEDGKGIRVYYQDHQNNLLENAWDRGTGWYQGGFRQSGPGFCPLAAITWANTPQIRVYTVTRDANLVEYRWMGSRWEGPQLLGHTNPGSFLSAVDWSNTPQIRVYFISESDQVKEEMWTGNNWAPGSTIPTGNLQ